MSIRSTNIPALVFNLFTIVLLTTVTASGQTNDWSDYGYVYFNGGVQVGSRSFSRTFSADLYDESALFNVSQSSATGGLIDVGGAIRLWNSLGLGIGITTFTASNTVNISGLVPHPLFYNSPRTVTMSHDDWLYMNQSDLIHRQVSTHISAVYVIPISDHINLSVSGGPSVIRVTQDFADGIAFANESYPADAVIPTKLLADSKRATGLGFHTGFDVAYMLTDQPILGLSGFRLGVGVAFRYTTTSTDFNVATSTTQTGNMLLSLNAGGTQIGAGLRVKF